ncbi:hypothetical protein [Thermovibrio ammonificans]|uniref:Uncharacterized protein n=1 Tax=Thermovibrio ammonificans (strain DSM 15698 / JCM 12110 / HB-1) TaxID=648996 RepID=E8T5D3_THEA1|nr:hypothetical protein [Thermovibrio ammonificans]ADU97587.1 hypothetical protein Theam_1631 [Thermovibrio ammonificans HB-1]
MSVSDTMKDKLEKLNRKRKSGELSSREYYKGLMLLLVELADALQEEDISELEVKRQIPVLKVFITEQLKKMKGRGN